MITRIDALELALHNLAQLVRILGRHHAVKVGKRAWSDRVGHRERDAPVFSNARQHCEGLNTPSSYTASSVSFFMATPSSHTGLA